MKLKFVLSLMTWCLLAIKSPHVDSSKILAVYPFPGRSHFMMQSALIKELVQKGHQVTMITAITLNPKSLGSNYTEILIEPVYNFRADLKDFFGTNDIYELSKMGVFGYMKMMSIQGLKTTEHALKQPNVQAIINAKQTEGVFDLLLAAQFYQEAFLALSYKYNIPIVTTSTLGYENHFSQKMGIIFPWSFVPHGFMPLTDRMNFVDRLRNSFFCLYEDLEREVSYLPKMDQLVQKYFSHLPIKLPKVTQMEKNISAILLNSYAPLSTTRPSADSMIPIGGLHIYPAKPLPADMQLFLDEAKHGAIFFSLGSNVQSKDMPADKLRMFLNVFAGLKQRVLWKFENESITDLPSNIMIKNWLPQRDILAHRNVKVFITHGGLGGIQEGVHNAVPMLGMPIYTDQHLNMKKSAQDGYAINLDFRSITEDMLRSSLQQLLENPIYKKNVQRVSKIFRDRPMNARETAIYWIEYVIRHKGAPHMRSAGLDLKWYQFYLLDVIAFVVCGFTAAVILVVVSVRLLLHRKIQMKPHMQKKSAKSKKQKKPKNL